MLTRLSLLTLITLAVWLAAPCALASAKLQQYHAIIIAHDNLPMRQDDDGQPYFGVPVVESKAGIAVGWEPYTQDPNVGSPLAFTRRDALRFERFMVKYGLPERVTTLLPSFDDNTTSPYGTHRRSNSYADVERAFEQTAARITAARTEVASAGRSRRAEQVVFIHFSGHGTHGGLLLQDELLSAVDFRAWIEQLDADLVVVILDSCYGAGWNNEAEPPLIQPNKDLPQVIDGQRGVAVFKSTNLTPESEVLRSGVLTHVVLSGLMGGADDNRDDRITFAELSDYFYLRTNRSGQFDGRPESPGGNHQRVLFDLRHGVGVTPLTFQHELQGRVLLADEEGVIAELTACCRSRPLRPKRSRPARLGNAA